MRTTSSKGAVLEVRDSRNWLLIETLSEVPTVIAEGDRQRQLRPLGNVLRGKIFESVSEVVAQVRSSREPLVRDLSSTEADACPLIAHPLIAPCGEVFGVHVHLGEPDIAAPHPPRAAAWTWRTNSIGAPMRTPFTSDFRDLYGILDDRPEHAEFGLADLYRRIPRMSDVAVVMNGVDSAVAGDVRSGHLIARHDSGRRRLIRYVRRSVSGPDGVVLRGIDHDVTAPGQEPLLEIETADADIAHRIARSSGSYTALVEVRSGWVIRWISEPIPGLTLEARGGAAPLLPNAPTPSGEATTVMVGSPLRRYCVQALEWIRFGSSQAALMTFTALGD
ncbi:GAF domain-containing protein [Nocardia sp. NBC_01388]|uniref:GAF domain-containing protein n=1 Tax=Nocardia sp. NBC_01388 TaxID=2903596 RepID=UPI00325402DD